MSDFTVSYVTTAFVPDNLVARNAHLLVSIPVTLASGQNLKRGALLGQLTSGGNYVLSLSAASDGSQTPVAVLAQDCDASGGARAALVYIRGDFQSTGITFGASHTVASTAAGLQDRGIFILTTQGGV
jgi:hypothetical protein